MANKEKKVSESIPGKYYVDEECTACVACEAEAQDNFKMNDDGSHAFVYKQPENEAEVKACEGAKDTCPVEAIGDDGES